MKPIIAIIGRPNVGKSTLFNRLISEKKAIETAWAGTTRDRLYGDCSWRGKDFLLVDTAGIFINEEKTSLLQGIQKQIHLAINEADLILFVVDGKSGLTEEDKTAANFVRKSGKPVILVVNKIDQLPKIHQLVEFNQLGLGEVFWISALHGKRTGDLLDLIVKKLKELGKLEEQVITKKEIEGRIAIIGRPNVGKSTLFNKIIGEERAVVSEIPGTTRDSIDTIVEIDGLKFIFIDTAGLRRRAKVKKGIEIYSFLRTLKAINSADLVLLVLEATEKICRQEIHIALYAAESGKSIILVVNKWDLIKSKIKNQKSKIRENYLQNLRERLPFMLWVPVIFVSAKTGENIDKLKKLLIEVFKERNKTIEEIQLIPIFQKIIEYTPPPYPFNIYKIIQKETNPPLFVLFTNQKKPLPRSYLKYLENELRRNFHFIGTPIFLSTELNFRK